VIQDNSTPLGTDLFNVRSTTPVDLLRVSLDSVTLRGVVASDAAIQTVLDVNRDAGAAAVGDGVAIDWSLTSDAGTDRVALQFAAEWSSAVDGAETSEAVFSALVAGVFTEALRFRNVGLNTAIVSPLGLTLNPNGDTDDGLQLQTVSNDVYLIPLTATNEFYLGNTVADPSVDLNRGTARAMSLVPLGTTLTTASPAEWVNFGSTVIMDYPNNSIGGLISATGTFQFDQAGNGFGAGNLFKNAATFKNENGTAAGFGSQYTFVNTAVYQADGAAISSLFWRNCLFQTQWNVINAGTLAITTCNPGGFINPSVGAGVTITNMRHWEFTAGTYNGTVTDNDLIYMAAITGGTNMSGIRSLLTAAANRYFIRHTGNAQSLFGGDVEIDGALNHDGSTVGFYGATPVAQSAAYTPTNVTPDRAYDANSTTLDELADVLGTLIADLQAVGLIA
jgi:hypothetical protein